LQGGRYAVSDTNRGSLILKRTLFRIAVDISDNIDIWVSKTFNIQPKHRLLVVVQDTITKRHLQNTIGKAIGASNISENKKVVKKKSKKHLSGPQRFEEE
jgi:hypothetical protein